MVQGGFRFKYSSLRQTKNLDIMSKITKKGNHIFVPDHVTIPYIEGDGVGHEITPVSQKIVNAAIKQAYNGTRSSNGKRS